MDLDSAHLLGCSVQVEGVDDRLYVNPKSCVPPVLYPFVEWVEQWTCQSLLHPDIGTFCPQNLHIGGMSSRLSDIEHKLASLGRTVPLVNYTHEDIVRASYILVP